MAAKKMRRNKMKRVFACLVAALLITAGCIPVFAGGGQAQASSGPVDYGKRTTGPNYWMVKSETPVTLHVVNEEKPLVPFARGDDPTKNEWTRGIKERLNIDLVTDWVSTTQGYNDKFNLAIAAGELPDFFSVNSQQFMQLVGAGLVADLTDYVENNLSDYVKKIMASSPGVTESAKINGRLMAIPKYGYGDLYSVNDLWIRHDWAEQAKISAPKSVADLEKIMDTFMAQHPGSYGMPVTKNLEEVYYLGPAFKATPGIWTSGPDGSIVYGTTQPEMKPLIAQFADWYKRGYLRKDFMSQDGDAMKDDMTQGKAGLVLFAQWAGWNFGDVINANGANAYLEPYEIPTADGRPGIFPIGFDNYGYTVVNAKSKNIAAALKCMSYHSWIVTEATTQGIISSEEQNKYLLGGEGRHTMQAIDIADPYSQGEVLVEWAHAVGQNNFVITTPPLTGEIQAQYENAKLWYDNKNVEGYGRWIQVFNDRSSGWIGLTVIKENRYVVTKITGAMPEEAASYGRTLDDLLLEGFTKIIIGEQPISYFDALVNEWKSAGGNVITAAVNRVYGKK
jgi:putative aldouronate transport system substrate-binding protein